jgi:hypothetical protein
MLTVKNLGEWGLKECRANERGPSLVGSLGLSCQYKRFLFCLGCCSRSSTMCFFPHRTLYFNSSVPIVQQAGQAVLLGHLSLSICVSGLNLFNKPFQLF